MFRYLTVILLFIAFSAQTFSLGWLVLDYSANKASYQRNCENKAKPIMQCHGKCQFYKKIKSEQQQEQQYPETKSTNIVDLACSRTELNAPAMSDCEAPFLNYPLYVISFPIPAAFDIFHPPA